MLQTCQDSCGDGNAVEGKEISQVFFPLSLAPEAFSHCATRTRDLKIMIADTPYSFAESMNIWRIRAYGVRLT